VKGVSTDRRKAPAFTTVDRVVAVMRALRPEPQSLAELSRATGIDEATMLRYLRSLVSHRFAERDEGSGRYSLGAELIALSRLSARDLVPRRIALPYMERLVERYQETVNLAERRGDQLVVIEVVESPRSIRKGSSQGDPDLWHSSSLGKAILAHLPEHEVARLLEATPTPRLTPRTLVTPAELAEELERIRVRGYAVDDEESEADLRCVGAAIRDVHGRPRLALSVSGLLSRMPEAVLEEMGREVARSAADISRQLGASDVTPRDEEGDTDG
jgi:DNA-binding IclR family transcriptional regulator